MLAYTYNWGSHTLQVWVFALVGCNQDFHSNLCKHQASFHLALKSQAAKQPQLSLHSQALMSFQKTRVETVLKGAGINHELVSFRSLSTESIAAYMAVRLGINAHNWRRWQVSDLAGAWGELNTYTKSYELSVFAPRSLTLHYCPGEKVHISKTHTDSRDLNRENVLP